MRKQAFAVTAAQHVSLIDDGAGTHDVGQDSSVTIGIDGNLVVSYFDAMGSDRKVAHCKHPPVPVVVYSHGGHLSAGRAPSSG